MAFDIPQTPAGRWELYIDALRTADPNRQCIGDFVKFDQGEPLGCAMTMIARAVFGLTFEDFKRQSVAACNATGQIMEDLVAMGFDGNWIMRMNDRYGLSFRDIAAAMEKAPLYAKAMAS